MPPQLEGLEEAIGKAFGFALDQGRKIFKAYFVFAIYHEIQLSFACQFPNF